jgi:intein/homing endonuclease
MKFGNYNKVNSKGVIPENTLVENRDIIISKVTPIKENRNDHTKVIKYEDQSKIYRTAEEVYIDRNYIDRNGDGYSFAKVRLRAVRKPVIGDKFSSRHGQKGTVGNIIPEQDMPFMSNGTRPDIIINPHAIPSRMTIGQLKETLLGKVLVELGLFGDGTSFGEFDIKSISENLLNLGYEANGNEILYNGLTGEQIECNVFMGPVFYQRLKHMVSDKTHSRSIGPMVNLTRQPAEGRSRDGGLRFGEMERDCEPAGTPLTLSCGLSTTIEKMEKCDNEVLGWSEEKNGMIKSKQIGFMNKGERECIQLTFEDGRTNTCTPDHPVLTSTNEWVKAKDLVIGETSVKASVTCPVIDIQDEITECSNWSLNVGTTTLTTDTREEYLKTLAFMRILGYLVTDGGIYKDKNCYSGQIHLGHKIDVETCLNDVKQFCNIIQQNFKTKKNGYIVRLPSEFLYDILELDGIQTGAKIAQAARLPTFILNDNCPRPIVREFLGGMFGGDGHTCYLGLHRGKRDLLTSISFSKSKRQEHLESLTTMMTDIQRLLGKCGIHKTTIQNYRETSSSKKTAAGRPKSFQLTLHLDMDELVPFSEKIGFRYCCHKSQRLEAGVSYKRLRNEVVRQHNWLTNRVDEITNFKKIKAEFPDKIVSTKKAIVQATEELKQMEPLIHEYAIPSTHDITDHLIKGTSFGKFTSKSFPTAEEFMERIGALDWFIKDEPIKPSTDDLDLDDLDDEIVEHAYGVEREMESLPTMNLKIIDIRPVGLKEVFDIEVEGTNSFLANGIVAHNCMISHGAARFTRGRLYDASDKYSVNVCKKCGLIAAYNDKLHIHHCKTCDNRADFAYVEIPYACKLLFQELITMNVAPRIITDH